MNCIHSRLNSLYPTCPSVAEVRVVNVVQQVLYAKCYFIYVSFLCVPLQHRNRLLANSNKCFKFILQYQRMNRSRACDERVGTERAHLIPSSESQNPFNVMWGGDLDFYVYNKLHSSKLKVPDWCRKVTELLLNLCIEDFLTFVLRCMSNS